MTGHSPHGSEDQHMISPFTEQSIDKYTEEDVIHLYALCLPIDWNLFIPSFPSRHLPFAAAFFVKRTKKYFKLTTYQ